MCHGADNERSIMTLRLFTAVCIASAALVVGAHTASAAGGNGASFCSNAGAPVGGAPDEIGNPGELISWVAQNVGHGQDNHPGPFVASFCNPTG
jgi:hypothetical protein